MKYSGIPGHQTSTFQLTTKQQEVHVKKPCYIGYNIIKCPVAKITAFQRFSIVGVRTLT
jgi:hypothetical protein